MVQHSNPFAGRRDSAFGNRHERRARKKLDPPTADDVVRLTPKGQAVLDMILEAASNEAGRPITGQELLEVMRRVRTETGIHDIDLKNPAVMDSFKAHLRALDSA